MRSIGPNLLFVLLPFFLFSCAGNGSPLTPQVQEKISQSSERTTWGTWDVYIDPLTSAVETVPVRGASFECNVVNFLQPPSAPIHLLTIQIDPAGTNFPAGRVACDVAIKHPFPGTKFCGFDVMGIVMGDWPGSGLDSDTAIITSLLPGSILQNPDGYSRWWNMPEFTTYGTLLGYIEGARAVPDWDCTHTLNPFKYFSDDLDPFDAFNPDLSRRGFFSSVDPGLNKRRYELRFPVAGGEPFHFKYAISASWVAPFDDADAPYEPGDFPLSANMPEAYKIQFVDTISSAYYAGYSVYGGDIVGYIEVRDWQIQGSLPNIPLEIESVTVESPTLFPDPIDLDLSGATFALGNPNVVWIPLTIEDVTPTSPDNQLLIITVNSGNVTSYEPQIPGITGFDFPEGDLAAYNIIAAPIEDQTTEPDGQEWSMFRRTLDRNGRTTTLGPVTDNVIFTWQAPDSGGGIPSGIVFDSMLRLYFRDEYGTLYCVTPGGQTAWSQVIDGFTNVFNTPTVGPDDSVYIGSDVGDIWHFDKDGNFIWCCETDCNEIDGGTAVLDDGSVIVTGSSRVVKVDPTGNEAWIAMLGCGLICCGPTIDDDGNIYVTSIAGGKFICLDPSGSVVWEVDLGHDANAAPVLGEHGIYFGDQGGNFRCFDFDGSEIWSVPLGQIIKHSAAIGHDGRIYVGTKFDRIFYCLDPLNGDIIWQYSTHGNLDLCSPVIDGAGRIYIGDWNGWFYCFSQEGALIWSKVLCNCKIKSKSPAIAPDGTLAIGTWDGQVWAFRDQ